MIIRCNDCGFISKTRDLDKIITEKVEHEKLNDHKIDYIMRINNKDIIINPVKSYRLRCLTCWDYHNESVMFGTLDSLEINLIRTMHSKDMKKKDEKQCGTQLLHEFSIHSRAYKFDEKEMINNSTLIQSMLHNNVVPSMISNSTDISRGNDDIAFYMRDPFAKYEYVVPCVYLAKNICPICYTVIDSNFHVNYHNMMNHLVQYHQIHSNSNHSNVYQIIQQCMLFESNNKRSINTRYELKSKYGKKSCAVRVLNKMGVPLNLLGNMFNTQQTEIGDMAYRGMEILGKPSWVRKVES